MKVLLVKDVHKLGRAGEIKRVADGYGRNYLIPQGLALKATPSAMKQVDRIRQDAQEERSRLNLELGALAETLEGLKLSFPVKAGETGKLYGSITTSMISEAIKEQTEFEVDRRQIDSEPIKTLGVHEAAVRLTIDLIPNVTVLVHREGEAPESAYVIEEAAQPEMEPAFADLQAELEAEEQAELDEEAEFEVEEEAEEAADESPEAESETAPIQSAGTEGLDPEEGSDEG